MYSKITLLCVLLACAGLTVHAQISTPPGSDNQKSITTQYIGSQVHVSIIYNSPDVTGPNGQSRKGQIWGQLVPYGMATNNFGTASEIPWRAGANENTVFKVSHDVMVQGKPLPAGKYGLHIIPQEKGPWTLIFSKNSTSWGSYFYDPAEDALRVEATPEKSEFHEWLTFEFIDRKPNSTTVALKWEELMLPFTIEVPNIEDVHMAAIRDDLRSSAGFSWQNWVQAAQYAAQFEQHQEEALAWAEKAANDPFIGQQNFATLSTKAQVLMGMNRTEEASKVMDEAIRHPTASPGQIHQYGRRLIGMGMKEKALEVFKFNYDRFDGAWPTEVGLARGYSAVGQYDKALEHAKKAHEQAPDTLNKDSMAQAVENLKQKKDIN